MNLLLHEYKIFRRKYNETTSDLYTRFTMIVTSLHILGRELSNSKMVNKILCCLLDSFDVKVTTIFESKDVNIFSMDNLMGSLIAYK